LLTPEPEVGVEGSFGEWLKKDRFPPGVFVVVVVSAVLVVTAVVQDQVSSGGSWSEHESEPPPTLDRIDSSIPEKKESGQMLETWGNVRIMYSESFKIPQMKIINCIAIFITLLKTSSSIRR
jgi:hypothetical protein